MNNLVTTPAAATPLNLTFDVVEFRSSTDGAFLSAAQAESGPICTGFCCCCCCCGVDSSVQADA